jgi:hypothetical protein
MLMTLFQTPLGTCSAARAAGRNDSVSRQHLIAFIKTILAEQLHLMQMCTISWASLPAHSAFRICCTAASTAFVNMASPLPTLSPSWHPPSTERVSALAVQYQIHSVPQ